MELQKHDAMRTMLNSVDMKLGYLGYATVDESWMTEDLAAPFHRLYFIRQGSGTLTGGGVTLTLEPGQVYLLPAGLPCSYSCRDSLSQLFFHLNLTQPDGFDLLRNVRRPAAVAFSTERMDELQKQCCKADFASAFAVKTTLLQIFLQMHDACGFSWDSVPEYSKCVAIAMQYIGANPSAQLRIDELAQVSFVSRSHLTRQFRREVGLSVKEYLTTQLVGTAQRLLSHTETSVEKISSDLGFCNQFYFSEWFKKNCRVSPLQYRRGTRY